MIAFAMLSGDHLCQLSFDERRENRVHVVRHNYDGVKINFDLMFVKAIVERWSVHNPEGPSTMRAKR